MGHRIWRARLLAAVLAVPLASCAQLGAPSGAASETAQMMVDYPYFASVSELCEAADVVVIGTPLESRYDTQMPVGNDSTNPEENPLAGTGKTLSPEDQAARGVPITVFRVRVDQTLKAADDVGAAIDVGVTGGMVGSVRYEASGDGVLKVGEPTLLFLSSGSDGTRWLVAGAQAQFLETSGGGFASVEGSGSGWGSGSGLTVTRAELDALVVSP